MVESLRGELSTRKVEIEQLKLFIAKLKRMQFGRKSEKLDHQIEQLELKLEDLQSDEKESAAQMEQRGRIVRARPERKPLPPHLQREEKVYMPEAATCTDCGGDLWELGEDVSEQLEFIPASFKVIRHIRPKLACACCDRIFQAPAPSRPIERGMAGPGLLAHVLVSKFADHLPLYRQSVIYAREGIELSRSLLADWVGSSSNLLRPLVDAIRRHVMAGGKLHADDTPVPVLAPAMARPRRAAFGPTCETTDRPARPLLQQSGLPTRRIAKAFTRRPTWFPLRASCRPMPMPGSMPSMKPVASTKRLAGRMPGANSSIRTMRGRRP